MTLSASTRGGVERLHNALDRLPEYLHTRTAIFLCGEGLMRGGIMFRFAVWLLAKRRRMSLKNAYATVFSQPSMDGLATGVVKSAAVHALHGVDADGEGVGGFNQWEFNKIVNFLNSQGVVV